MLNSLLIRNYRNLKDLKINSLKQINLITGRNNTGKSSLLEAISLYASGGDYEQIYDLLRGRGERIKYLSTEESDLFEKIKIVSSIFYGREVDYSGNNKIEIGTTEGEDAISIRFVKFYYEEEKDSMGSSLRRKVVVNNDEEHQDIHFALEIKNGTDKRLYDLGKNIMRYSLLDKNDFQFIKTTNIETDINSRLWDKITLTEKEKYVVEALKIVEPGVERIAFVEDVYRKRKAVIKLSGKKEVYPLLSMGDGINRILTIILALVNTDNGYLLVDEFENGLHYTVQRSLWEMIFKLAQKLDVQVFVTTHSNDCIRSFESVLNKQGNSVEGMLLRLDDNDGQITSVGFDKKELDIATDQNIEIR